MSLSETVTTTMEIRNVSSYYPVTRFRRPLSHEYMDGAVEHGLQRFTTYAEAADFLLNHMDTDDSDCAVCVYIDGKWFSTNDGKTTIREIK